MWGEGFEEKKRECLRQHSSFFNNLLLFGVVTIARVYYYFISFGPLLGPYYFFYNICKSYIGVIIITPCTLAFFLSVPNLPTVWTTSRTAFSET